MTIRKWNPGLALEKREPCEGPRAEDGVRIDAQERALWPDRSTEGSALVPYLSGTRSAPAVIDQPFVTLTDWRVHLIRGVGLFLVGLMGDGLTFRVTSPLVSMDCTRGIAQTSSGRLYRLDGPASTEATALLQAHLVAIANAGAFVCLAPEDVTDVACSAASLVSGVTTH